MSLKNPVTPPGINPGTIRLVAQCLNHYTTPGPLLSYVLFLKQQNVLCTCLQPSVSTNMRLIISTQNDIEDCLPLVETHLARVPVRYTIKLAGI